MIIKRNECHFDYDLKKYVDTPEGCYDMEVDDELIIKEITCNPHIHYYIIIDGKMFKSDRQKGLKSIFFSTREKAEEELKHALYWRKKIIPNVGAGVGYDVEDFYKKLLETHKVEIKELSLMEKN